MISVYCRAVSFLHNVLSDPNPLYSLFAHCNWIHFLSFVLIFLQTSLLTDLPSAPGSPVVTRNTNTSVVVSWGASKDVRQLVGYYIECSVVGTDVWMPCNNKPVKQTR